MYILTIIRRRPAQRGAAEFQDSGTRCRAPSTSRPASSRTPAIPMQPSCRPPTGGGSTACWRV